MPDPQSIMPELTYWKIDECAAYFGQFHVCGWCHVPGAAISEVEIEFKDGDVFRLRSFGLASPDVDTFCGPGAQNVRFDEWITITPRLAGRPFLLRCRMSDGRTFVGSDALTNAAWGDPYFQSWENFLSMLASFPCGSVLELGSRARSAVTRRHRIPTNLEYVGVDIVAGPNVDIVADAHELSSALAGRKFVAVFSTSVFEHLAMPWKVVLEMNRALTNGGLVYTATHQSFPVHDEPWDFWRYSQHTWKCLFNRETGFDLVDAVVGEPARIFACRTSDMTRDLPLSRAWLGSACIARKVSDSILSWPVSLSSLALGEYPSGVLSVRPTTDPV